MGDALLGARAELALAEANGKLYLMGDHRFVADQDCFACAAMNSERPSAEIPPPFGRRNDTVRSA